MFTLCPKDNDPTPNLALWCYLHEKGKRSWMVTILLPFWLPQPGRVKYMLPKDISSKSSYYFSLLLIMMSLFSPHSPLSFKDKMIYKSSVYFMQQIQSQHIIYAQDMFVEWTSKLLIKWMYMKTEPLLKRRMKCHHKSDTNYWKYEKQLTLWCLY